MIRVFGRWNGVDAKAEEYYSQSTYHFSGNNPLRFLDLNGMNYGDFIDEDGNKIGNDGISDGKVYVLKTTRRTTTGADGNGGQTPIKTDGITRKERKTAENFISTNSGNQQAFANNPGIYNSAVELPEESLRNDMANIVNTDNGSGGKVSTNNQEHGGQIREEYTVDGQPTGQLSVIQEPSGAVTDPSTAAASRQNASITYTTDVRTRGLFHSHPSGTNGSSSFIQGPSLPDVQNATNSRGVSVNNYVFARGEGRVCIYSTNGVKATLSMAAWQKRY